MDWLMDEGRHGGSGISSYAWEWPEGICVWRGRREQTVSRMSAGQVEGLLRPALRR